MSGWYGKGKQRIIDGTTDWVLGNYFAVVIDEADYTYSRSHASMASVPVAARQGNPVQLASKTVNADGEIDCADFTVTGLLAGQDTAEAVLIYEEAAAADASRYPLAFFNGMTIIPNGGNYTFQVPNISPFLGRF